MSKRKTVKDKEEPKEKKPKTLPTCIFLDCPTLVQFQTDSFCTLHKYTNIVNISIEDDFKGNGLILEAKDYFKGKCYAPVGGITKFQSFQGEIISESFRLMIETEDYEDEETNPCINMDVYNKMLKEYVDIYDKEIDCETRDIYCYIAYPITNPALIKFTTTQKPTYGFLMYCFTQAYKYIYDIEDQDVGQSTGYIPGMSNREESNGRFGIWGHTIANLYFNGISDIKVYNNGIWCTFGVDS